MVLRREMDSKDTCWTLYINIVLIYIVVVFLFIVIPAAFNISFGLRVHYINMLLKIFQYGYKKIDQEDGLDECTKAIIDRSMETRRGSIPPNKSCKSLQNHFRLDDICEYTKSGIEAIIEDAVTCRFDAAELPSWNLLTRTNSDYHFICWRLTLIWALGFFVRYLIFLPIRITLVLISLTILSSSMAVISVVKNKKLKDFLAKWACLISFRILVRGFSASVNYHNRENMAQGGGICVANHTSPIDAILLSCDRNYTLIGQMQGSVMGLIQKALLKSMNHIFFERGEMKDRLLVVKRMREHASDVSKNPILIFPEGTCINNTSVMMFKKGSFEVGAPVYPVAIKYDLIFGNAFWNSSKESMLIYILNMVTSWAIVCDIWYMPVVTKKDDESAIEFANRVKKDIAVQGGLVDLVWDGGLKRAAVPPRLKAQQQEKFATNLKCD